MSSEFARRDDEGEVNKNKKSDDEMHARETARMLARGAIESHFSKYPNQPVNEEAGRSFLESLEEYRITLLKQRRDQKGKDTPLGTYAREVTHLLTPQVCLSVIIEDLIKADEDENILLAPNSFSGLRARVDRDRINDKQQIIAKGVEIFERPRGNNR